jgi:EmrB/QacA subfamily drug resistance transporter
MSAVAVAVLLATIDGSIVNVALPTIRAELDTSLAVVQWVPVGYLLTLATLTLGVGRLGDIIGKKRIYTTGFVVFTVASVACGLAPTIAALIVFRVAQAVGAVMMLSLGIAILTEAFPPGERGKALGVVGTFVSIGVVTGPVVGGILIAGFDWRAIFFVNLPVGIVGTWMARRYVPDTAPLGGQRFDVVGALVMSGALLATSLAVTGGQELGYGSLPIVALFAAGLVLALVFVGVERRSSQPMLDLAMFRSPPFAVSVVTGYLAYAAVASVFFLLPFYLEGVLGYDTRQTGLALGIAPLLLGLVSPIAGSWSDRVGIRRITLAGLVVMLVGYGGFITLTTDITFLHYALIAAPIGLGLGMFQSPNNSALMGSVPAEHAGVAGGMVTLTRLLGQITGVAVLGSLWAARVAARTGSPLNGDATTAPEIHQVAGLRDMAVALGGIMLVSVFVTAWGLRRERAEMVAGHT